MPSVPISVQNANMPGGPVILGADGKIPSSAMPVGSDNGGSSGGGGGTVFVNATAEIDSNKLVFTTEKSASEAFSELANGNRLVFFTTLPAPIGGTYYLEIAYWRTSGDSWQIGTWVIASNTPLPNSDLLEWTSDTEDGPLYTEITYA